MREGHRYYVRSPDGGFIFGFDRIEAATATALDYGEGAALVDTQAQAYYPMLQMVRIDGQPQLVFEPVGGWDTGRFSLERDLIEAVKKGRVAIVDAFLAKGASADARDEKGGTALHWAVARGQLDVIELLLAHGADAGVQDAAGCSALELAERRDMRQIAEALRKRLPK